MASIDLAKETGKLSSRSVEVVAPKICQKSITMHGPRGMQSYRGINIPPVNLKKR
jgi:hypothetical protein